MEKTEANLIQKSDYFNQGTKRKNLLYEINNSFYNHHIIVEAFESGRAHDLGVAENIGMGKPIILCGSGPSFDEAAPLLKDWDHAVMCSTSHAATLIYHGTEPDYIVALDYNSNPAELDADTWEGRKSTLVLQPGVTQELMKFWKGEMLLFRQQVHDVVFYDNAQKIGYSKVDPEDPEKFEYLIPRKIVMFASVIACELFIAHLMGYSPIYLIGCDFVADRFTRWGYRQETEKWFSYENSPVEKDKIITATNRAVSLPITLFYKKNFISAWRLDRAQVINTSEGAIPELPRADIKDVIHRQGKTGGPIKGKNRKEIIDISEKYLATQNTYIILREDKKCYFIESDNPETELYKVLVGTANEFECENCKLTGQLQNDKDPLAIIKEHSEIPCPRCNKKTLKAKCRIDVDKNMRRIRKLSRYAQKITDEHRELVAEMLGEEIHIDSDIKSAGNL